jgi:hypothetical protein
MMSARQQRAWRWMRARGVNFLTGNFCTCIAESNKIWFLMLPSLGLADGARPRPISRLPHIGKDSGSPPRALASPVPGFRDKATLLQAFAASRWGGKAAVDDLPGLRRLRLAARCLPLSLSAVGRSAMRVV